MNQINIGSVPTQKKRYLLFLLLAFALMPLAEADSMATIHGAIYEWDTFEPLENVIVEVNSTPPQSMLARYGIYSFNLAPGNYLISASYYRNSTLVHHTEEEIIITDDGDYVIDIIFLPTYYEEGGTDGTEFEELDELAGLAESEPSSGDELFPPVFIYVLAFLIMVFAGVYLFSRRHKGEKEAGLRAHDPYSEEYTEHFLSDEHADLPADLQEVVNIIAKNGGRITQKDLRSRLKHSEAKVSLMISDLENRGLVRKFKKGRGNVIILNGPEKANQNV
ncbi:MAG: winged helix-turn-helix transcriptional regulator [Methanosarcinaceae archaeon]|nr:winged helix-turn-helix transcriptional regulator [Methanosarcinaceae archaeon]